MFDIAWSEFALIGLVAVMVLGPKELPNAMRTMAKFTRQARRLAGEFQGHVNELIREAELDDLKKSVNQIANRNIGGEIEKMIDPTGEVKAQLNAPVDDIAGDKPVFPPLETADTPVAAVEAPKAPEIAAASEPASPPAPANTPT